LKPPTFSGLLEDVIFSKIRQNSNIRHFKNIRQGSIKKILSRFHSNDVIERVKAYAGLEDYITFPRGYPVFLTQDSNKNISFPFSGPSGGFTCGSLTPEGRDSMVCSAGYAA
jgi:hypothetical protein